MKANQEFLILLRDYEHLKELLKAKAWEITPDDIKDLLCRNDGLCANNIPQALEWLIKPKRQLDGKCPAKAIVEGKTKKVKKLLRQLNSGACF